MAVGVDSAERAGELRTRFSFESSNGAVKPVLTAEVEEEEDAEAEAAARLAGRPTKVQILWR